MSFLHNLTDTWNAIGTVFTAIRMNVTNTASAAGSKLIDLLIGGVSKFSIDTDGGITFGGISGPTGVGAVSLGKLFAGCDYGTWVPADASGAGLVFTVSGCFYVRLGPVCLLFGQVTYPATADGTHAQIGGIPFDHNAAGVSILRGIVSSGIDTVGQILAAGTKIYLSNGLNTNPISNANMTGKLFNITGVYRV